jgi:hypothetical protein
VTANPNSHNPLNGSARLAITFFDEVVPKADPKDEKEM